MWEFYVRSLENEEIYVESQLSSFSYSAPPLHPAPVHFLSLPHSPPSTLLYLRVPATKRAPFVS